MKKKGITLVASIIAIVFASMVILSTTTFIVQRFSQEQINRLRVRCIYLAQAGIHNAIYYYRLRDRSANGYFSLGRTNIDIDPNSFFVVGGTAADLLMINTSAASLGGSSSRDLEGLRMQNATSSKTITINRMIVAWSGVPLDRRIERIRIRNSDRWTGGLATPADCDINDFSLGTQTRDINYLRFNGDMAGATIDVTFVMTDGTSKTIRVYPASQNFRFTVKSTGKTTDSNIYRTVMAEYNGLTGKVVDYDEIDTQITP